MTRTEGLVRAFGAFLASGDPEDGLPDGDEIVVGLFAPDLVSVLTVRGRTVAEVEAAIGTALEADRSA